ncbi:hypothetical protein, partial [Arsenicicoccus sp. UBA2120]
RWIEAKVGRLPAADSAPRLSHTPDEPSGEIHSIRRHAVLTVCGWTVLRASGWGSSYGPVLVPPGHPGHTDR